jgi:predicted nucleic acid-binding protein
MAQDYVFDSSAVIAYLQDEPGTDVVDQLIEEAARAGGSLLISAMSMAEVWHIVARARKDADAVIAQLFNVGFMIVDVDWSLAQQCAQLKLKYKLSTNDCCAAALARRQSLTLVTCDNDFKAVQQEIKMRWLKKH